MGNLLKIKPELLDWQKDIWHTLKNYRYVIISAGRQSGKTTFCMLKLIEFATSSQNSICWWISPQFSISKIAYRRTIEFLISRKIPFTQNKSELSIKLDDSSGATIWFKSGDNPDSLRGETVNFLVIDEMGVIKRDVWELALRGTITVTQAQVLFIGTPKGKNLFYELYIKGASKEPGYISYQYSSNANKYFSEDEWEEVQKLPQRIFEQEYLAQFIDDGGEVFRNLRACVAGQLEEPDKNKRYYAGVDLAKTYDYTVVVVVDENKHLVAFDRYNNISWDLQKQRIISLINKYDAYTLVDSTGVGDPILEDLRKSIKCEGYKFTSTSKQQLIEALSIAIEKKEITYPDIPELINELNIYTFEQTATGSIRYNAPSGLHDDCVIALALANWKAGRRMIAQPVGADGSKGIGSMLESMLWQNQVSGLYR